MKHNDSYIQKVMAINKVWIKLNVDSHRFTRPESLGSESKIKCNKCRSYQVCTALQ